MMRNESDTAGAGFKKGERGCFLLDVSIKFTSFYCQEDRCCAVCHAVGAGDAGW